MSMTRNQLRRRLSKIVQSNFDRANNTVPPYPKIYRLICKDIAFLAKTIMLIEKKLPKDEVVSDVNNEVLVNIITNDSL